MRIQRQPDYSNTCGQHCVAMIADIPAADSIAVFKSRAATSTKKVAAALRELGFPAQDNLVRFKTQKELPALCMLRLKWKEQNIGHWVVYRKGTVYDPAYGRYRFSWEKLAEMGATSRFYLRIG